MGILSNLGQKIAHFFGETDIDDTQKGCATDAFFDSEFLSSLLHYRLYDPITKIYENENSFGFFLELVPLLGMSESSQKQISALINSIGEDGASIQCMIWADPRIDPFLHAWNLPRQKLGSVYEKVANRKMEFFRGKSFQNEPSPRIFRILFSYSVPRPPENKLAFVLKGLSEKREKAFNTFQQFNNVVDSTSKDLIRLLSGLLNFEQDTEVRLRNKLVKESYLSDQICLPGGGIEVNPDYLRFLGKKETLFKSYEVFDFPDFWSMTLQQELLGDFMNNTYRLSTPFYIHYGIHFPNQDKSETRLRTKSKYLDHQAKNPLLNKRAPQIKEELEENLCVTRKLQEGEKIVETRLSIGVWSAPDEVFKSEAVLESLFRKYGFKIQQNKFHHINDFLFSLPMAWGEKSGHMKYLKNHLCLRTTYTIETANFMPLLGEWWGNSRDGQIFLGRRGQIAAWDPFNSMGNYNVTVVGSSGQGKSVFMQDLVLSQLGKGTRVFIIDLGRSFEKLCKLLGGEYLFFNQHSNLNLNPFQIASHMKERDSVEDSIQMVASIVGSMAMPHEDLSKEKMDIIYTSVKEVWHQKGAKGTIDDVVVIIKNVSFGSELMKGTVESLCIGLEKYMTTGIYTKYFYGDKTVDFTSNLVVIETEELSSQKDLQAVIMQVFVLQISKHILTGNREQPYLIPIDECSDHLKGSMSLFLGNFARRTRKYRASLVIGTQGFDDFKLSRGAEAVLENSDWFVAVGGDPQVVEGLRENKVISNFTEGLGEILRSMHKVSGRYGESFIYDKRRQQGSISRLFLDPFSAMLYSTKAEEFSIVQRLEKMGYNVEDSIEWLLENKNQIGKMLDEGKKIEQIVAALFKSEKSLFSAKEKLSKMDVEQQQAIGDLYE